MKVSELAQIYRLHFNLGITFTTFLCTLQLILIILYEVAKVVMAFGK